MLLPNIDELDDSDIESLARYLSAALRPQGCEVCAEWSNVRPCDGCQVINYCGTSHQQTHHPYHKTACDEIKKTRAVLDEEEAKLRNVDADSTWGRSAAGDLFKDHVGRFWDLQHTRDYMMARWKVGNALLEIHTIPAVEQALEHFTDMMRLDRSDSLRARHHVPFLLLRLGKEQECYDFVKWWLTIPEGCDWESRSPYLDVHGADAFESVDSYCGRQGDLTFLVALTLLKMRMKQDVEALEEVLLDDMASDSGMDDRIEDPAITQRPMGKLMLNKVQGLRRSDLVDLIVPLDEQCEQLCRTVQEICPYLWKTLLQKGTPRYPTVCWPGSQEEANRVVNRCKQAWEESGDVLFMLESEFSEFVDSHEGSNTTGIRHSQQPSQAKTAKKVEPAPRSYVERSDSIERRRGSGKVFPTIFDSKNSTNPRAAFPARAKDSSKEVRHVSITDARSVLVFIGGSCSDSKGRDAVGGWAVVSAPPKSGSRAVVYDRLEDRGPFEEAAGSAGGGGTPHTSIRAELRAAVAALRLFDWRAEGFDNIVIACDSTYVIDGATASAKNWVRKGWKTRQGTRVQNRDLWELLLGEVERWSERGVTVAFWRIARAQNGEADAAAKMGTKAPVPRPEFRDVSFVLE